MPRALCPSYRGPTWSESAGSRPGLGGSDSGAPRCLRGFRILGAVETLAPEGFRDAFFRTTAALGVAKMVFLDGATPEV